MRHVPDGPDATNPTVPTSGSGPGGRQPAPHPIALALQGGGAHGAYSMGLIEELLACGRFSVAAVSGTSAGALNGAALVDGLSQARGAPPAQAGHIALRPLGQLWDAVADASPLRPLDLPRAIDPFDLVSDGYDFLFESYRAMTAYVSPAMIGGPVFDVLRQIVSDTIDIDRVRQSAIPFFAAATNVRSGGLRLFTGDELSHQALLASACLPELFPPVEIDGEAYWDGGFVGNPPLAPLVEADDPVRDIVVLQVTPFREESVPRTAQAIVNRITDITFSAALQSELAIYERARELLAEGNYESGLGRRIADLRIHVVAPHDDMAGMAASSKFDTRPSRLHMLRDRGRERMREWLAGSESRLGDKPCGVRWEKVPMRFAMAGLKSLLR